MCHQLLGNNINVDSIIELQDLLSQVSAWSQVLHTGRKLTNVMAYFNIIDNLKHMMMQNRTELL